MAINNISNNQILNNPALQRSQTKEAQNDTDNNTVTNRPTGTNEAVEQNSADDTVTLSFGGQALRTEQAQGNEPPISPQEAANTANNISQLIRNNPQQAVQAFGVPDQRAVQSLLAAA